MNNIETIQRERDEAQSACAAWRDVFGSIEAHLLDRIAMDDQASPKTYLAIIRDSVENVARDSKQIVASRWHDYARHDRQIKQIEAEKAEILSALRTTRAFVQDELSVRLDSFCVKGADGKPDISTLGDDAPPVRDAILILARIDAAIAKAGAQS